MKKYSFFCLLTILLSGILQAQDYSLYQKKWLIRDKDTLPYRILLPKNFNAQEKYPLVLFLHGSGERGSDNEKQLIHGAPLFLKDSIRSAFPAIVVFPQCSETDSWSNVTSERDSIGNRIFHFQTEGKPTRAMQMVQNLLTQLSDQYPIDRKRMYVSGLSMGGMGTFELIRRQPRLFAAAFPICRGANPKTAKKLNNTAWWVFHGAKDNVVPASLSGEMVSALKRKRADVRFTLYPNATHNSWASAFAEKELLPWLFGQRK